MPRKNFKTMAKIVKGALSASLTRHCNSLTKKHQEKLKKQIPSLKQLEEELREINKEFKKFRVIKDGKELVAETKEDVFPGGMNFGRFKIRLRFEPTYNEYIDSPTLYWYVEHFVTPIQQPRLPAYEELMKSAKCHYSSDTRGHPHLVEDDLCTGTQGRKAINHAARALRIADIFFLLNSVLNGYNAGGAYETIEEWNTIWCEKCNKEFQGNKELYACIKCEAPYCKECIAAVCKKKDCKSAICVTCMPYNKGRHKEKCRVHKVLIGKTAYLKPKMKKVTKEEKKKFDGIKGWTF